LTRVAVKIKDHIAVRLGREWCALAVDGVMIGVEVDLGLCILAVFGFELSDDF